MWHEIAKEGYPPDSWQGVEYLITDGEDYFIGNWREDANAWDNFTSGWVRKYYDGTGSDDSLAKITHWMELPPLPNSNMDIKKIYENFKEHVSNMSDNDIIESIHKAELEVENLFGNMRESTPEENQAIDNYIKEHSIDTGINIWDLEVGNISKHQSNFDFEEEYEEI